jgi:hypothetical protein
MNAGAAGAAFGVILAALYMADGRGSRKRGRDLGRVARQVRPLTFR